MHVSKFRVKLSYLGFFPLFQSVSNISRNAQVGGFFLVGGGGRLRFRNVVFA